MKKNLLVMTLIAWVIGLSLYFTHTWKWETVWVITLLWLTHRLWIVMFLDVHTLVWYQESLVEGALYEAFVSTSFSAENGFILKLQRVRKSKHGCYNCTLFSRQRNYFIHTWHRHDDFDLLEQHRRYIVQVRGGKLYLVE